MTTTAWAHLPNAAHIDRVIASLNSNPGHWVEVRGVAWDAQVLARNSAWHSARQVVRVQSRDAEWDAAAEAAWLVARNTPRFFAQYAILALVAYDDCAYMLDSDPGELAILAAFGDHRAILLLSACKVFYLISQLT